MPRSRPAKTERHSSNHCDQQDLDPHGDRRADQISESRIDLHHAKPERRRYTEHRAEHRENIDRVTDRAVNALADQRVERRAERQWRKAK